jgi:hypothetical protein
MTIRRCTEHEVHRRRYNTAIQYYKYRDIRKTGSLQDVKDILAIKTGSRYINSKRAKKSDY